MDPASAERVGLTIFVFGEVGGRASAVAPPLADSRRSTSTWRHPVINKQCRHRWPGPQGLRRLPWGASAVSVSILDDQDATTRAVDRPRQPPGGDPKVNQTWTATIPASRLASQEGHFNITATFTGASAPQRRHPLGAKKDTVDPAAPTASHTPGRYPRVRTSYSSTQIPTRMRRSTTGVGATPPDPDATTPVHPGHDPGDCPRSRSRR